MLTFTALTRPVATATPAGDLKIARPYRWIPDYELAQIARIERQHLECLIDRAESFEEAERRWQNQVARLTNAADADMDLDPIQGRLSPRQAVIAKEGALVRRDNRDTDKSRSHSRAKAARRDRRTIRQLALAA